MFALIRIIFTASLFFSSSSFAEFRNIPRINILASSSMTNVMSILVKEYSERNNTTIMAQYGASGALLKKLNENPEEVDIFISSKNSAIRSLINKSYIDESTLITLFSNRLTLIVAKDNNIFDNICQLNDLREILMQIRNRSTIVLSDPEDSLLGFYSSELLRKIGMWKIMQPVMALAENSVETQHLASEGYRSAIIYKSDLHENNKIKELIEIPVDLHPPIIYRAIALNNKNHKHTKKFLEFLKSPYAKRKFEEFGFAEIVR